MCLGVDDLKILFNDWPYGLEQGIVHLVVWTKFELEEDPTTGLLTPSMWKKIDDYVERVFRSRMPADQVRPKIWFDVVFSQSLICWTSAGRMVQELEVSQVYSRDWAFPCDAEQSGSRLHHRHHEWRCPDGRDGDARWQPASSVGLCLSEISIYQAFVPTHIHIA